MDKYKEQLMKLVHSIEMQIPLKDDEIVLILYKLQTRKQILAFMDWIEDHLEQNNILATKEEILRAAVTISKK